MSRSAMTGLLLRLYPEVWRARYGEELEALIVETSDRGRVSWRTGADVALAAGRERLRATGLSGDGMPPRERVRAGSLLVLCAWALFVIGGAGVQKASEHWQTVTPSADRGIPSGAFDTLIGAAALATALVLAGIAATLPSVVAFLRNGGWPAIRRRVITAAVLSVIALAMTAVVVALAHRKGTHGLDLGYGVVAAIWALLVVAGLASWTAAAVATARRLPLSTRTLRVEAWLAAAVTAAMAVMTAAAAVWWAAVANAAPWFFAGRPVGASASAVDPQLLTAAILMLIATLVGTLGAERALRSLAVLSDARSS